MTVLDLLSAFTTQNVIVAIMEKEETVIKFYSEGYMGVESDILARDVDAFDIIVSKVPSEPIKMYVYLKSIEVPNDGTTIGTTTVGTTEVEDTTVIEGTSTVEGN